jgi:hypothetical protein
MPLKELHERAKAIKNLRKQVEYIMIIKGDH